MAEGSQFGARLRELREAAGLTQKALAEAAGLTPDGIVKLEGGIRSPGWETVLALGLTPSARRVQSEMPCLCEAVGGFYAGWIDGGWYKIGEVGSELEAMDLAVDRWFISRTDLTKLKEGERCYRPSA